MYNYIIIIIIIIIVIIIITTTTIFTISKARPKVTLDGEVG